MTQVFTGPPTITNPLTDQVIKFNTRVTLDCTASGGGTIEYQWQLFNKGSWMNKRGMPEYTTTKLKQSHRFRCVASNEAGETKSVVIIYVLSKHTWLHIVSTGVVKILLLLLQQLPLTLKANT